MKQAIPIALLTGALATTAYAGKPLPPETIDGVLVERSGLTTATVDGVDRNFVTSNNAYVCVNNKFIKEALYNGESVLKRFTLPDGSNSNCITSLEDKLGDITLRTKKVMKNNKRPDTSATYHLTTEEGRAGVKPVQYGQTCSIDNGGNGATPTRLEPTHNLEEGIFLQVVDVYQGGSYLNSYDVPGFWEPAQFDADCSYDYEFDARVFLGVNEISNALSTYDPTDAQLKVYAAEVDGITILDENAPYDVFDTIVGAVENCYAFIEPTVVKFKSEPEVPGHYNIVVSDPDVLYDEEAGTVSWLPPCGLGVLGELRHIEVSYSRMDTNEESSKKYLQMRANQ